MRDTLRHLRALQVFDETARCASLSRAAQALNVTHGAVSRQVALLEQHLGVSVFRRTPNGVELTPAGERLVESTRTAFSTLRAGVRDVRRTDRPRALTVSLSTSLALKWLVPALGDFKHQHPEIALLLDTDDSLTDFTSSDVDVALRFGSPGWDGLFHELVCDEELVTVAAPALVAGQPLPFGADAIVALPLLHDAFNGGWERWALQAGLTPDRVAAQAIEVADSGVLLEAAVDGHGVALARHVLAARDLERGRLVRLEASAVPLERGLYAVCRAGEEDRDGIRAFRDWLRHR
ncbi:MAG: LysR substrate-binding domain-containing protein [Pseudomonadota bacterium]